LTGPAFTTELAAEETEPFVEAGILKSGYLFSWKRRNAVEVLISRMCDAIRFRRFKMRRGAMEWELGMLGLVLTVA